MTAPQHQPARRLLIVCPTWVGDIVMATPTLRALRGLFPEAHITALGRETLRPLLDGCPWIDRIMTVRRRDKNPKGVPRRDGPLSISRRLTTKRFDTAVLLPNSFRTALLTRLAGIPRRIGYERDGRGFLLTDRLLPRKQSGRFVPVPTRDYYLGVARYLGAENPDPSMQLFTRSHDDARADDLLRRAGHDPQSKAPLILINPGAKYGDAKLYFPDRFAQVADRCIERFGAVVAVTSAPDEKEIVKRVIDTAKKPLIDLGAHGLDLTLLKSVIKRCRLLITNDTGPRHIAAALGAPVVSIFGPTDPAWTEIDFTLERQVRVDVDCGPCQKKRCPLLGAPDELICMKRIESSMVFEHAAALLTGAGVSARQDVYSSNTTDRDGAGA